MSKVHLLFPTPLYQSHIDVDQKWLECVKSLDYVRTSYDNGWITSDLNIWKNEDLKDLCNSIKIKVEDFGYEKLGVARHVQLDIVRGWSLKHNFKDWSHRHYHTNSIFSGIYYLNVYSNSGNIVFEKSEHYQNCFVSTYQPDLEFCNHINNAIANIKPVNGTLLIFPSQLLHRVEKNMSKNDRYCISFDVFIRGNLGECKVTDGL